MNARSRQSLERLQDSSQNAIAGLGAAVAALEVLFADAAVPEASRIEKRLDDLTHRLLEPLAGDVEDMFLLARKEGLEVHPPATTFTLRETPTTAYGALRTAAQSMQAMTSVFEAFRATRDPFLEALARDGTKTMAEVAGEMHRVAKDVESAANRIRRRGQRHRESRRGSGRGSQS